ncbi:MAG TPA: rod shape-determining protein MreC [Nitrospirota bacterium]|nr:rod shape-determining protein MreC [Nitrospirota bacterium]
MNGFIVKNKKSIILLLLFTTLFWLVTVQVKKGRYTFLERPVLAVSGFLERIIIWPFNTVVSIGREYIFLVNTEQENQQLQEEIGRLRIKNGETSELLLENNRLREMLNFKKLQPPSTIAVQVIGKELSPASSTVTINKGSNDQIQKDMAVITADGVVGRVETVLPGTSKVFLLTDPGSTVAVMVQRNREEGLLEGKLVNCALKYVSYYADIQEGDLVVTSGLDGIYPKGLAVGTVAKVVKREAEVFQTVVVKPAVQFSRLEEALVLTK